jgi:hypothetical protein
MIKQSMKGKEITKRIMRVALSLRWSTGQRLRKRRRKRSKMLLMILKIETINLREIRDLLSSLRCNTRERMKSLRRSERKLRESRNSKLLGSPNKRRGLTIEIMRSLIRKINKPIRKIRNSNNNTNRKRKDLRKKEE